MCTLVYINIVQRSDKYNKFDEIFAAAVHSGQ